MRHQLQTSAPKITAKHHHQTSASIGFEQLHETSVMSFSSKHQQHTSRPNISNISPSQIQHQHRTSKISNIHQHYKSNVTSHITNQNWRQCDRNVVKTARLHDWQMCNRIVNIICPHWHHGRADKMIFARPQAAFL